ncbi:MAG: DUF1343 domain-containing protein [Acidobacteria bacterium]|nr:DUF1343 domain-containing protein [Acidobacteriota bacterium]
MLPSLVEAQNAPPKAAASAGVADLGRTLDAIVERSIAADEIPGAVLLVSHQGRVIHRKAYGSRSVLPQREPMTVDTIFDLASLTKVIATTSAVMKLVEQGQVALNDPLARYIPEFAAAKQEGKDQVTIRQLLTHTAGLAPIPRVPEGATGAETVLRAIYDAPLVSPPGARLLYSDSGFILLGELVRRVSGKPLDEFVATQIFGPLGMRQTRFRPPVKWISRTAPTEEIDLPEGAKAGSGKGRVLRGVVHDPRARSIGGVAGHAGLFSTADDLALFCRMLLSGGRAASGKRIFAAAAVRKMTTPQTPPWSPTLRGLGWDIDSTYSSPRGELFPLGSFGHTGFTGTAVWIDPSSHTIIILLTNSVHPHSRPPISSLRSRIATAVAAALQQDGGLKPTATQTETSLLERSKGAVGREAARNAHTNTGLDVLVEENFAPLRGKRVGLITNHTGLDRNGRSAIDLLAHAEGVKLVALFSPEHGIAGRAEDKVASSTDPATGLPIYSLYSETRRPTDEMLRGMDALVFDLQDAGVRFYTYVTTMAYAMEEAAKRKIAFYVLDRPNPLGGQAIEGPMLDGDRLNFVGYFSMPVRYAMTLGELAQMFNAENRMGCDLHVIAMKDWRRQDGYDSTGLPWVAPSPNLRSLHAALLYPGVEILQSADVSVGRGTDTPFELFGAPWIRATELADYLNRRFVPGVRFVPTHFTPRAGPHKDQACEGVALLLTDRASFRSMLMGLEISAALAKLYPDRFDVERLLPLVGSKATIARLKKGDAPGVIVADWSDDLEAFKKLRAKYLLYP